MTGMDVLRRCRAYESDMARLRLRLACTRDAATRITRSPDAQGHGGGGDRMSEYAARVDDIEAQIAQRKADYARELDVAVRLISTLEPMQGSVMHARMVRCLTIRQTAGELHIGESSVRGLYRRAREELEKMRI